jgi:hypothetical protein
MVRTGARAAILGDLLAQAGLRAVDKPKVPRPEALPAAAAAGVLELYRRLGGVLAAPPLRPGAWDLAFDGDIVVELDEELHQSLSAAHARLVLVSRCWLGRRVLRVLCRARGGVPDRRELGKRWTSPPAKGCSAPLGRPGSSPAGARLAESSAHSTTRSRTSRHWPRRCVLSGSPSTTVSPSRRSTTACTTPRARIWSR